MSSVGVLFRDLVEEAIAAGRAAVPTRLHTDRLAEWLGAPAGRRAAVGLDVTATPAALVVDFVPDVADAEVLVVRTGVDTVAAVPPDGAQCVAQPGLWDDGRHRVVVPTGDGWGPTDEWRCDIEAAVARATILRVADAAGAASAALDAAVAHVSTREQFGAPLGTLQAVQHRLADMAIDVTIALGAVHDAAEELDAGADGDALTICAAYTKVIAVERCRRVTAGAHQLAGGQGILEEAPFHRWFRRAKVAEASFGTVHEHRAVLAAHVLDTGAATNG